MNTTGRSKAVIFDGRPIDMIGGVAYEHEHAAAPGKATVSGYAGPVARTENRAAHGGIRVVETCWCGARRTSNRNGGHVESGIWVDGARAK